MIFSFRDLIVCTFSIFSTSPNIARFIRDVLSMHTLGSFCSNIAHRSNVCKQRRRHGPRSTDVRRSHNLQLTHDQARSVSISSKRDTTLKRLCVTFRASLYTHDCEYVSCDGSDNPCKFRDVSREKQHFVFFLPPHADEGFDVCQATEF